MAPNDTWWTDIWYCHSHGKFINCCLGSAFTNSELVFLILLCRDLSWLHQPSNIPIATFSPVCQSMFVIQYLWIVHLNVVLNAPQSTIDHNSSGLMRSCRRSQQQGEEEKTPRRSMKCNNILTGNIVTEQSKRYETYFIRGCPGWTSDFNSLWWYLTRDKQSADGVRFDN